MSTKDMFSTKFEPQHGNAVSIAPGVMRVTCGNTGPFTFQGTNSYILGEDTLAVIDPGPEDEAHLETLLQAIDGRDVSHIVITHTHIDHSPLAAELKNRTGAKIVGAAPHFAARELHLGEINALDASADRNYKPDEILNDGQCVHGSGWTLQAIATPGHTANHLSFALTGTGIVFTGDHIMAWATSIVAPPDGSMSQYMASLDKMLARDDRIYFPGHGGPVNNPKQFVRGLKTHRKMRERAILDRMSKGDETIPEMVKQIYRNTDPRLHGAAGLSVFAQLEALIDKGLVLCDGDPSLEKRFKLTESMD